PETCCCPDFTVLRDDEVVSGGSDREAMQALVDAANRAIVEPPAVDVAPIAKLTARDGLVQRAGLYAPGLPDGDHDVFPVPLSPKGELRPHVLAEPPSARLLIECAEAMEENCEHEGKLSTFVDLARRCRA